MREGEEGTVGSGKGQGERGGKGAYRHFFFPTSSPGCKNVLSVIIYDIVCSNPYKML